ncbi:TonB-dependent receptor [Pontibacter sp. 172403-2]|uniref:SusC/RagA family TonB-linked outer membrane protein n=1 Tax=Pontibacter rufus TaxID=2791028 RepID=UPI0018AFF1E2|nr:TonB-dependent receptor [Pontibacter sp. 172403-2]MBF9251825.1 TonB-dependent receptor [Pontibacter sp. 172403-2]
MKRSLLICFALMFALLQQALAQSKTVSGIVTDQATGQGLPGVSVIVKGTTVGAATSADGSYAVNVPANANTLVFRYIGYETKEVPVGGQSVINVTLAIDNEQLSEVVITGYGSTVEKELTGSVASVGAEELEDRPVASVDQLLQGQVAGLQSVGASGQPGASQEIRIRGIGSINAGSNPLYVVDGVIINTGDVSRLTTTSNQLAGINPNDIESISVLKDAASTSIYGSRGANGVILITTKKGRAGKTKFNFSTEQGYTEVAKVPDAGEFLTAEQWLELTGEGLANAGADQATVDEYLGLFGQGNGIDTDWRDLVTRRGTQQTYNLSASGGNEKTRFYASAGLFDQEAPVIGSELRRISGSLNLNHTVNDKIDFFTTLTASNIGQNTPSNGGAFANPVGAIGFLLPTQSPYNADGSYNISQEGILDFGGNYNPLYLVENDKRDLSNTKILGSAGAGWNIIKGLRFSTQVGVDYINLEERMYWNPFHGDGTNYGGYGFDYYTRIFNWTATNLLNYRFTVPGVEKLTADVTVGYEAQESNEYRITSSATNFPPTTALTGTVVAASPSEASASGNDYSFSSVLSRANITYADKYVLSGSFRRDGSSRFGSENRYGNFWSIGASWNVDEEAFMQAVEAVSTLKLRTSYGVNGNGDIANYAWRPLYGYGINYNQQPGGAFTEIGNTALTWEQNKPFNVGIDLGFLSDRITLTADYYVRTTSDLLFERPISRTTGFIEILENVGEMKNRGLELAITGYPIDGAFKWRTSFNFATNENEITELPEGEDIIDGSFILREGLDYRTFYVRQWAGVDEQTGDPLWWKDADKTETTSVYSQAARVPYESASPKFFGGFNNTFSYKGFTLDALIVYNFGNYVRDSWEYYMMDGGYPLSNKYAKELDRWQQPGDVTDVPRYEYQLVNNSSSFSTRFLYKGDFIRLRNLQLGYDLPSSLLDRIKLTGVNVYVRGTNLLTKVYDEDLPIDPEAGVNGLQNANIPINKAVTFGLNVSF